MTRRRRVPAWLLLLALCLTPTVAGAETKRILALPPTRWDHSMTSDGAAEIHGPSDLSNLTGGIGFGLSPSEVNAKLPNPTPGVDWEELPFAGEYPIEVRYFWVRFDALPGLAPAANAVSQNAVGADPCVGGNSYVVFLFHERALFRISWRMLPDKDCASTHAAAEDLYTRLLTIDGAASTASHYRAGTAEVVEVTDPNTDYLIPYRWQNRQRR